MFDFVKHMNCSVHMFDTKSNNIGQIRQCLGSNLKLKVRRIKKKRYRKTQSQGVDERSGKVAE